MSVFLFSISDAGLIQRRIRTSRTLLRIISLSCFFLMKRLRYDSRIQPLSIKRFTPEK